MYFKRIEIHGFKSFAEPVTIEFDRGITCVVGPNGSGKSNICDAIRWVLGAQSAKMLRGDKMEDVIFSGTESRKSRGMAEVTLVIDNSLGELEIDYNEVAITRRMYRSGESEYLINNNQCRMKDIRELIMDTGIGVEGYSIIGQGKISDIISNNTESIREILEETAGIVMYRSKKSEAERKLKSAAGNMERVGDIIGEIEGRIDGLKRDSDKATEFLGLRERHKELEINITLKNIENIELKNEYIKDDIAELDVKIQEGKENSNRLAETINVGNQKREELDKTIEDSREKQLNVINEINSLVNQGEVNSERLTSISQNHSRLIDEITSLEMKINNEKESSKEFFDAKKTEDEKFVALEEELKEKVETYGQLSRRLEELGNEIDSKKNRLFNLQSEINSKKSEINSIDNLKKTLENRKESILADKNSKDGSNKNSEEALIGAQGQKEVLEREILEKKKEQEALRNENAENIVKEKELAKHIEFLKVSIGQISSRKKTFEEMESNYDGYNNAVKFIMKEQLSGINGVVAELIKVPVGLEVAIETALGATVQHVVCEDDATAKEAISRLKKNNAGRLTFLPLESIRPKEVNREDRVTSAEGFKGYAIDCLDFEEKYRPALQYLIGNVIVMDNMDNAIELSKRIGRMFKLVTVEGEIINAGGTITGGRHKHKSANIIGRKSEIAKLDEELLEKEEENKKAIFEIDCLKKSIENHQRAFELKNEEIREKEREMFSKENEIIILGRTLDDYEDTSEKWQKELDNIQKEQETSDKAVVMLTENISLYEDELKKIEDDVEDQTKEYNSQKEFVERANEDITKAKIHVGTCQSEKEKVDALVERANNAIGQFEEEKRDKEKQLELQQQEKENILSSCTNNESILNDKEEIKKNLDDFLNELSCERNQLIGKLDEYGRERESIEKDLNLIQSQKYELDIKQARQDTQLENAKAKLWEEFEVSYVQAIDFKKSDFVMGAAVKENREIKNRIKALGEVNVGAIKEYETVSERYEFLTKQRDDIVQSMNELKKIISDMDKVIRSKFKESFNQVVENFEIVFKELYGGGSAKIVLEDEDNPFDSEIEITAQPPGKQLKHINLLSGGEKTMTAIALMFAVLRTKPTPCCVLDEIEAALDDSNLEIFGTYVKKFGGVQFTLITHQKSTMEHADVMYGITMPESGISKVYSLKMGDEPLM